MQGKNAKTILIVDDEPHIRALLEETLEDFLDHGVSILTASEGGEALKLALTHKPDLILLDVMMPQMNGFDICEAIKKKHKLSNVYIVMLTAKGQEADKEKGSKVSADEYMTKPFDPDEVVRKVSKVLGIDL